MAGDSGLVKELRQKTGAGIMDCKQALVEANGDLRGFGEPARSPGLRLPRTASGSEQILGAALVIERWRARDLSRDPRGVLPTRSRTSTRLDRTATRRVSSG